MMTGKFGRLAAAVFALALGALAITSIPQFTSDVSAQPNVGSAPTQVLPDFADLADRAGPRWSVFAPRRARGSGQSALPFPDIDENDPMFEFFRRFFPESAAATAAASGPAAAGAAARCSARPRLGLHPVAGRLRDDQRARRAWCR